MEKYFRKTITLWWQWPRVLLRPLALHFLPYWTHIGLYYPSIHDNPFSILLLAGILMSYGGGSIIKFLFYKPRPIPQAFHNRLQKIDASSFPSIHTTNASLIAIVWSWWWHQSLMYGADSLVIVPIVVGIWWICAGISLSRIALGKHYPIDVLAWLLFGVLITSLLWLGYIYWLFYWR
jgi:membrane-associated phospholipid phosphatase